MGIKLVLDRLRREVGDLADHLWLNRRLILSLAGVGVLGAGIAIWSGIYDVAASKGHWRPVGALLNFGMRMSVATHSRGVMVPPLDDQALVRRGAGHFQGGCSPCHGAPGIPPNPLTRGMLPAPPELGPRIREWRPEELFRLVMHGLKYTGMPAWPALDRPDEVWAIVAFLHRLPELDVATYRNLAFGEMARERAEAAADTDLLLRNGPLGTGIASCGRCHGRTGREDADGAFPKLAGQSEAYLLQALQDYARGSRLSGIMGPIAATLTPDEMSALARHYAIQARPAPVRSADQQRLARGREIATSGLRDRRVAACSGCHDGQDPRYPRLAGQNSRYIEEQLVLWMRGARTGEGATERARIMGQAVGGRLSADESLWPLSREDIRAVATWYAHDGIVP